VANPRAVQAGRALPRPAARCPGRPRAAQAGRALPRPAVSCLELRPGSPGRPWSSRQHCPAAS